MPDISVIIVTRNTRDFTCAAVRSVMEAADDYQKEVIVVDNGSSDGTGDALRRDYPDVDYVFSDSNLGFAKANSLGAARSSGRFILLLNSDARLKPDSLRLAMEFMTSQSDCGVVGAQLLNPDGTRQNSIANLPTLATELLNKSLLRRLFPRRYPGKEHRFSNATPVESVIGAFMLIHRDLWTKLGGLDESYFFFLEETDLCLRTSRCGHGIWHLPNVEVWHEQGKSAGQISGMARIEYWRSRYIYFRKNHRPATRLILVPGLLLRLAIDWLANGLATALSLGALPKARNRFSVASTLWYWHLLGCPAHMGLPR